MAQDQQSPIGQLNDTDWVKIGRHFAVVALAAGITYILSIVGDLNLGKNTVLVVPALSLILKVFLQLLDGNTK